jgi:hypothetical protein
MTYDATVKRTTDAVEKVGGSHCLYLKIPLMPTARENTHRIRCSKFSQPTGNEA